MRKGVAMQTIGIEKSLISECSGWDGDTWTIVFHDAVLIVPLGGALPGTVVELALDLEHSQWELYDDDGIKTDSGPLVLIPGHTSPDDA